MVNDEKNIKMDCYVALHERLAQYFFSHHLRYKK